MIEIDKYKKYIGKYVRNQFGIAKIIDVTGNKYYAYLILDNNIVYDVDRETNEINDKYLRNVFPITEHIDLEGRAKDIIDLIEVGNIVHTRDVLNEDFYYMFDEEMVQATKETIQTGIELVDILTKEQYVTNCYKVKKGE